MMAFNQLHGKENLRHTYSVLRPMKGRYTRFEGSMVVMVRRETRLRRVQDAFKRMLRTSERQKEDASMWEGTRGRRGRRRRL